jgi:hypothetical protein
MKKPTESGEYPTSDPHEGQVFYERERLHGQTMPVYFGYIFEGLHRIKPNAYFDAIL